MSDDTKNTLCRVAIPNPKACGGWNICFKPGVTNLGQLTQVEFPSSKTDQVVLVLCKDHDAEGTNRRPMPLPKGEKAQAPSAVVHVPKDEAKSERGRARLPTPKPPRS